MARYYPHNRAGQINWHLNFAKEFPKVAPGLGFTAGEITSAANDSNYAVYLLQQLAPMLDTTAASLTGFVHTVLEGLPQGTPLTPPEMPDYPAGPAAVPPGIDTRRQARVERIKRATGYTPDVVGRQLGLAAADAGFEASKYKAELAQPQQSGPGKVVVPFRKAGGKINGINLYRQRAGEASPTLVKFFMRTPAVDTAPLAQANGAALKVTYTARAVVNDEEVGQPSESRSLMVS